MNLPINYISKQNLVHEVYSSIGVPFPAGIETVEENENENVQIKGDDEPNTEK